MKKSLFPISLDQVSTELQAWRETKRKHENKIPEEIKEKIIKLLKVHPREDVIKALRLARPTVLRYLNHQKTRLPRKAQKKIPFVEIPSFVPISPAVKSGEVTLEFPCGIKIRIVS